MIPKKMNEYLRDHLPETAIRNRTTRESGRCFLELGYSDEHLLSRMGITCDKLGPKMVACVWDETAPSEIGGYVVVDNLAMGSPSMGGIRMLPDITPADIHNLARGMTLKNGAADLPYGGGKSGIVAEPDVSPEKRIEIVGAFARLIRRYQDIYVPGPDVGTNDADMKTVAMENGLDGAVSKPADMGGNRIDELGAAAGGVVIALQRLLEIMPRLTVLPQFANLKIPNTDDLTILIQGFGAVGAHVARVLSERLPDAKTVGISDMEGYLYDVSGLPTEKLFDIWKDRGAVVNTYYKDCILAEGNRHSATFSTNANNLLRESAFCMVPAAPIFNYLGIFPSENPSMSVNRMGEWSLIIEGANTYSPDMNRKAARVRMEQIVYRQKGVMIANDYLVNSGGVIFAAQEHVVRTPDHLQIPPSMIGKREAVDRWLSDHSEEFGELSEKRLSAGEAYREKIIRRNMTELVDLLASDPGMLPCKAAEYISISRLSAKESERTAKDIMEPMLTILVENTVQEAAALMVEKRKNIIAVLSGEGRLAGVVTTWDITRAMAEGVPNAELLKMMTTQVVSASPSDSIIDIVRELEQNDIWAMPVVDDGLLLGIVTADLLTQRYLLQMLQAQEMD